MPAEASLNHVHDRAPAFAEVFETLTFRAGFNTNIVIGGATLLGLAAGVIGVFVLMRKRSLVTDALSHATLPGIGLAFLVAVWFGFDGRTLPVLLLGATVTGVIGVLCIQVLLRLPRLHEDAAIGIVLSVFFGAGVVVLSYVQKNAPEGSAGLNTFIYGQAAAMRPPDVLLMAMIAVVAIITTLLFYKEFAVVCFDSPFARVTGWPVSLIDLVMMALVVAVTVAGLQAVGLILVVAMLIIPPVAARFWTDRLWLIVILAGVIGALSGYFGSVLSALLPRKPAGAVIVLTCGGLFLISMLCAPARGVLAVAYRRLRLHLRIAADHVLEAAHKRDVRSIQRAEWSELARRQGWSVVFAHSVAWWLRKAGYVQRAEQRSIDFTETGLARGARVSRNHDLWEQYLTTYADIAPSHVDWSVDQVEHVLSEPLIAELEHALAQRGESSGAGR
ncbi:MAG: iron chelate uptake ABC transporter family permease subunit [Planctomycetota bacterium]